MKRTCSVILALILLLSVIPVSMANAAAEYPFYAAVKGGWLRLRAQPSYNAETIASYYTGTIITVNSYSNGWYFVTTPDSRNGYMRNEYLSKTTQTGVGTTLTVTSANGKGVCLRSGPSTAYTVLAVYPVGTKAKVISSAGGWHKIKIGNMTGYMMSKFLVATGSGSSSSPSTQNSYTAYVTSRNGLGVRLRSGAGLGYSVLGLYQVGTPVTVLQHNYTWDYISVGSRVGYMKNEFLTTNPPAYCQTPQPVIPTNPPAYYPTSTPPVTQPLTGTVSLQRSVSVGNRLYATLNVNVPSGDIINYCWMVGGAVVSYSYFIDIKPEWEGRTIYVRITANGYDGVLMNVTPCLVVADATATSSDINP